MKRHNSLNRESLLVWTPHNGEFGSKKNQQTARQIAPGEYWKKKKKNLLNLSNWVTQNRNVQNQRRLQNQVSSSLVCLPIFLSPVCQSRLCYSLCSHWVILFPYLCRQQPLALISCLVQRLILLWLVPVNTLKGSRIRRSWTQWKNKQLLHRFIYKAPEKHKKIIW